MRISDWSSDVCSSDLLGRDGAACPDQTLRIEAMDVLHLYRRVVRAMPPKTRRIFVMHRVHRRTYKEIAAELGVCVKTVEHHMSRALRLCRAAGSEEQTAELQSLMRHSYAVFLV